MLLQTGLDSIEMAKEHCDNVLQLGNIDAERNVVAILHACVVSEF